MKHTIAAITARGKNDKERGRSIGICTRITTERRSGYWPKQWLELLANPDIAYALYLDALLLQIERLKTQNDYDEAGEILDLVAEYAGLLSDMDRKMAEIAFGQSSIDDKEPTN